MSTNSNIVLPYIGILSECAKVLANKQEPMFEDDENQKEAIWRLLFTSSGPTADEVVNLLKTQVYSHSNGKVKLTDAKKEDFNIYPRGAIFLKLEWQDESGFSRTQLLTYSHRNIPFIDFKI